MLKVTDLNNFFFFLSITHSRGAKGRINVVIRINYADGFSGGFALRSLHISSRILRPWLLLFYAERIPVALPTDSVNAFESEIVDAGFKSRRRLIQSGMVIACVARGQESHRGGCSGVGRRATGWQTTSPNHEG